MTAERAITCLVLLVCALGSASAMDIPEPRAICAYCGISMDGPGPFTHRRSCEYHYAPEPSAGTGQRGGGGVSIPRLSSEQVVQLALVDALSQALAQGFLQSQAQAAAEEEARQRAAEAARLEAERRERERRTALAALVGMQRRQRDAERQHDTDDLAASLGIGFDTPDQGLVLSVDPLPPLDDPSVVDLSDRQGIVFPIRDLPQRPACDAADAEQAAQQRLRLQEMARENQDLATLLTRLGELERQLMAVRADAVALKREANALRRSYDESGERVAEAVQRATERGLSLLLDGVLQQRAAVIERLQAVGSGSRSWTGLVQATDGVNTILERVRQADDDLTWLTQGRDPIGDAVYLVERFELGGPHWTYGKAILGSALDLHVEYQAARQIAANDRELVAVDTARLDLPQRMDGVIGELRRTRAAIAAEAGIALDEIPTTTTEGPIDPLASPVPHPLD